MHIVFTGGHHNSALIVASLLKQRGHTIYWFGHKHSTNDQAYVSEEYKEVTNSGIEFIPLNSGKIHGGNPSQWFKFFKAIGFCITQFSKIKPTAVVAFGGYLAVPAVIAAWIWRIPAVSHEQTATLGMANKVMLPFLRKLFLTWADSQILVPTAKTSVVGLPIPTPIPQPLSNTELKEFFLDPNKPLLVITGGKQGAHRINLLINASLETLLPSYNIYHQAGNNPQFNDLKKLQVHRLTLPLKWQQGYQVIGYTPDFGRIVQTADIIIGRSGAHTVYDVIRFKKKFLAIPLPFSFNDEQRKNAQKVEKLGLGRVMEEADSTPDLLRSEIAYLQNLKPDQAKIQQFIDKHIPSNAAVQLADQIEAIIK